MRIKFKFHARRDEYQQIVAELEAEDLGHGLDFEISLSQNAQLRPKGVIED